MPDDLSTTGPIAAAFALILVAGAIGAVGLVRHDNVVSRFIGYAVLAMYVLALASVVASVLTVHHTQSAGV